MGKKNNKDLNSFLLKEYKLFTNYSTYILALNIRKVKILDITQVETNKNVS